jgi:OFA family oxalate/formate antiporter-like MFS transporter
MRNAYAPGPPVTPASVRIRIGFAAVALHTCIGAVYAGSVLVQPLQQAFGWSRPEITLAFSIAIALLGLSAAASGAAIARRGARWASMWALVFVVLGYLGSACAIYLGSKLGLYLCYGVVTGIGLGLGYIAPLGVLIRAFPHHRGMATGLAVTGFGLGPMVFGPVMGWLFSSIGLVSGFLVLAMLYASVIGAAAWAFGPHALVVPVSSAASRCLAFTRSGQFWCMWLMLCINISCGVALVSVAAPLLQELGQVSIETAAALVGLAGLFNAAGRIFWANFSDKVGRPRVWVGLFFLGQLSFAAMTQTSDSYWFQTFFMLAITCFGGGFACMPPYVADLFGSERVPHVYGWMMTALSAAGFIGPTIITQIHDATGSYYLSLPVFVCMLAFGCILSMLLGRHVVARHAQPATAK